MSGRAFLCALAMAWPGLLLGQTCSITSPTGGQLIQAAAPLPLTANVSSAPTAYKLIWSIDYQRWASGFARLDPGMVNDYRDAWQGAWTVNWYTGLNGDGPHTVSGVVYDIFGNTVATCPAVSFTVRIEGMNNQSINTMPNLSGNVVNGTGTMGFAAFNGVSGNQTYPAIDGMTLPQACGASALSGQTSPSGWRTATFTTTCFANGLRQVLAPFNLGGIADPYLLNVSFTSVTGNNITVPNHFSVQGSVVTFSTPGTLPAPLVAGSQWYWTTSATNPSNTVTVSIAGGVMTFTTSAANGLTANGTPAFVRNIQSTNQTTGLPNCDGYYTNTTYISAVSFSIPAPEGCPNGAAANRNLEVDINPYFVNYVDANTINVSASCGPLTAYGTCTSGSAVTLTGGGSGTVTQRLRSPYWTGYGVLGQVSGGDYVTNGGKAYVTSIFDFENGSAPMELEPPYWELHLVAGAASQSICPKIKNTDRSLTTIACNASGLAYNLISDGGLPASSVVSVDGSGNVTPVGAGWVQVQETCNATCAGNSGGLQTVTIYIQVHSGSVAFPHFTRSGPIATSYTPGQSFIPSGMLQLSVTNATNLFPSTSQQLWLIPMMQQSGLNSATAGLGPGQGPGTTPQSSCPNWNSGTSPMNYTESFAQTYGISLEFDMSNVWWNGNSGTAPITALAAILNNLQYNRQACVTSLVSHHVGTGVYWGYFADDEFTDEIGSVLQPNPTIGGPQWTNAIVSGGTITFTFTYISTLTPWSQAAGTGDWVQIVNATNTCLDGWYPLNSVTLNSGSPYAAGTYAVSATSTSSCGNGTYQPTGGTVAESSAQMVINPSNLAGSNNSQQNCQALPTTLFKTYNDTQQGFVGTYYGLCAGGSLGTLDQTVTTGTASNGSTSLTVGSSNGIATGQTVFGAGIAAGTTVSNISGTTVTLSAGSTASLANTQVSFSNLTSVVVSGSTATIHYLAHGIPSTNTPAIRISGSVNGLNVLAVPTVTDANTLTITYPGTSGRIAPSAGTYTSSNDPGLYITIDPNQNVSGGWGPNPLGRFYALVHGVSGHPSIRFSALGLLLTSNTLPTVSSWLGTPSISDAAFVYNANFPPLIYGTDMSVWGAINYAASVSDGNQGGLTTRAYQVKPRTIYWGDGFIDSGNTVSYCRSFNFNPACDRPAQLGWRPETTIAQIMGMKTLDIAGYRAYNFTGDMAHYYQFLCCGWQTSGTGNGNGMNPWNNPEQWAAMARTNTLLALTTHTELQPEANKPYYGPFFSTDAHTSSAYGNSLTIVCGSESPYGQFPVSLNTFSGGSVIQYLLQAHSLQVSPLSGNPSTITKEWCPSPGATWILVAQPATYHALDTITFAPPITLPFGATKFLVQVGYYPKAMQDDPVTDCTSTCAIPIDHHNSAAWYRVIYADSNNVPRSIGDPVQIPSQGLN